MTARFPPTRFPEKKPEKKSDKNGEEGDGGGNALWRIPEWFPGLLPETMERLRVYHGELLKFNAKLNLISKGTEREADELHFADCLYAADIILHEHLPQKIYDIGSGNGLPAIILGLLDPKREFIMVESDSRKSEFLKHAIHVLSLKNMTVMNVRFENLTEVGIETAVSRGFASIAKTLLMCNKIFPKDGQFFHLKGNNWSSEIAQLPSQLISVWMPELREKYSLPVAQARRAVVVTRKNQ